MIHQRVLITGCGGMLGNAIYPYFKQRCFAVLATDIEIEEDEKNWLTYLDVRDHKAMHRVIRDFQPDLILHLAAVTDLEQCETDPTNARISNAVATKAIAELAAQYSATLVYISTAGVFDGAKGTYYVEEDRPNPIMVYGATKLEGEAEVRKAGGKSYVIRAGWMVGGGRKNDHKFVSYIIDQMMNGANEIHAVTDKIGTPTYTHDFAMNLFALLGKELFGTYHMVCGGSGTRFDVAQEIIRICGRQDVVVKAASSNLFRQRFWAPRPDCEMLENRALDRLGINLMRDWRIALADYLRRDYAYLCMATVPLSAASFQATPAVPVTPSPFS